MLAHEHAGGAGVVEVDVAEEQVAKVEKPQPFRLEAGFESVHRRARPAVEERGAVVRFEHVAADRARVALVEEVDRLRHVDNLSGCPCCTTETAASAPTGSSGFDAPSTPQPGAGRGARMRPPMPCNGSTGRRARLERTQSRPG